MATRDQSETGESNVPHRAPELDTSGVCIFHHSNAANKQATLV